MTSAQGACGVYSRLLAGKSLSRIGPQSLEDEVNRSLDGTAISAPALTNGQSSEFSTFVTGAFSVSFRWQTTMHNTDELLLYVDDAPVTSAIGSTAYPG